MKLPYRLPRRSLAAALAAALLVTLTYASFTAPFVPAFRGGPCARYAGWETFTSAYQGVNSPDDPLTTATGAGIVQLVPGAIITSGGSIYDPLNVTSFVLTDAVPADLQEVVLQTSTNGNTMNGASVRLRYVDGASQLHSIPPGSDQVLTQSGMHQERKFTWDLSGVADVILAYELAFQPSAPSTALDAVLLDTRHQCATGVAFCFGDGSQTTPCPCANSGLAGRGCENSLSTGGALLTATGATSPDTIVFTAQGTLPTSLSVFLQGSAALGTGVVFGDGVRCVGGTLKRLYVKNASGGSVTAPLGGDPSVSTQSAALGDPLASGAVRSYQVYYRDPSASFCAAPVGNTWNVSGGLTLTW